MLLPSVEAKWNLSVLLYESLLSRCCMTLDQEFEELDSFLYSHFSVPEVGTHLRTELRANLSKQVTVEQNRSVFVVVWPWLAALWGTLQPLLNRTGQKMRWRSLWVEIKTSEILCQVLWQVNLARHGEKEVSANQDRVCSWKIDKNKRLPPGRTLLFHSWFLDVPTGHWLFWGAQLCSPWGGWNWLCLLTGSQQSCYQSLGTGTRYGPEPRRRNSPESRTAWFRWWNNQLKS